MINNIKIDYIGIGAQKSATTWIYKCLLEHPGICGCTEKETYFFSKDEEYEKGIDYYFKYFKECNKNNKIGEFSAAYLSNKNSAMRIKQKLGKVKIIVSLRDPVDRSYSHYLHKKSKKRIENIKFLEALKKESDLVNNGLYGAHLKRYLDIFSKENVLIVFYDDIKTNPQKTIKKIYSFLGVDSVFTPRIVDKKFHVSSSKFSFLYKFVNRNYIKYHKTLFGKLAIKIFKTLGITSYSFNNLVNKISKSQKKITDNERKIAYQYFKNDIMILENLLGIDLSKWKYE